MSHKYKTGEKFTNLLETWTIIDLLPLVAGMPEPTYRCEAETTKQFSIYTESYIEKKYFFLTALPSGQQNPPPPQGWGNQGSATPSTPQVNWKYNVGDIFETRIHSMYKFIRITALSKIGLVETYRLEAGDTDNNFIYIIIDEKTAPWIDSYYKIYKPISISPVNAFTAVVSISDQTDSYWNIKRSETLKLNECNHSWKQYQGFTDFYEYCEICDIKKQNAK